MEFEETRGNVERLNSYKISIGTSGKWSGEIKVYADTIGEAQKQALEKAAELEMLIKEKNKGNT